MRYYYLDALRSLLMMLGVFYHAALMYSSTRWRVVDVQNPAAFDALVKFNACFRMPTFFIIAGFFAAMSLKRHGSIRFLRTRAVRLLLPALVASFTLNVLQRYLIGWLAGGQGEPVLRFLKQIPQLFISGHLTGHLWFLYDLYLYYLLYLALAAVLWPFTPVATEQQPPQQPGVWACINPTVVILPLAALWILMMYCEIHYWEIYHRVFLNTFEVSRSTQMFLFFLFGTWLYRSRVLYEAFIRLRWWHLWLIALALLLRDEDPRRLDAPGMTQAYLQGLSVWIMCLLCFAFAKRGLDQPSRPWAYLSEASYTIYLFHQPFVVLLGNWLTHYHFTPYLKYPIVVGLTFAGTLAIHHFVILRIPLFRLLYNGKWKPKPRPETAPPAPPVLEEAVMKGVS